MLFEAAPLVLCLGRFVLFGLTAANCLSHQDGGHHTARQNQIGNGRCHQDHKTLTDLPGVLQATNKPIPDPLPEGGLRLLFFHHSVLHHFLHRQVDSGVIHLVVIDLQLGFVPLQFGAHIRQLLFQDQQVFQVLCRSQQLQQSGFLGLQGGDATFGSHIA